MYNTEFQCLEGDNALLTYGYVDHEAGLSFEVLCFAKYGPDKHIELRPGNDKTTFKIRYSEMIGDVEILPYDISMHEFYKKVKIVSEGYYYSDQLQAIRMFEAIDADRHPQFPDDVGVLLYKEGLQMERVWVRTSSIENGKIVGTLLNKPHSSGFGLNAGDKVTLVPVPVNGRTYLVIDSR